MRVALHQLPLILRALRGTAVLAPGNEELLLGLEAIDRRTRRALLQRQVGQTHAGEIADRLTEHSPAVMVDARLDEVALVLFHHALAALLKLLEVRLRPPGPRPSCAVELT